MSLVQIAKRSIIIALIALSFLIDETAAQYFPDSTIGQTPGAPGPNPLGATGTISGQERFLRRNRRRTSFVGRDRFELSRFVGALQGSTTGAVLPAVASRQINYQPNANITALRINEGTQGIYEPELSIGFTVPAVSTASEVAIYDRLLNRSPRIARISPISVSVHGRTAILQGVVASDDDRRLAEAYLRFEPGLSSIVNHLEVAPPGSKLPILAPDPTPEGPGQG